MPRQTVVRGKAPNTNSVSVLPRTQAKKLTLLPTKTFNNALPVSEFPRRVKSWLSDASYRDQSPLTIVGKRNVMKWLMWYMEREGLDSCGTTEIKDFLTYLRHGHKEPCGRFGLARLKSPPSDRSVEAYYVYIKGFFTYMVSDGVLVESPVDRIPRPQNKTAKPVSGYTDAQFHIIVRLLSETEYPERDVAIAWFLVDTGLREAELCSLKIGDIDFDEGICTVIGKGKKERTFCLGRMNRKMLRQYLLTIEYGPDDPLFVSSRGRTFGEALSPYGLQSIVKRLKAKTLPLGFSCNVHKFRHTFALNFLNAGGNIRTLQKLLGHATLDTTLNYLNIAEIDIINQHREFSPGDRLAKSAGRQN